ncbi:MAG: tRNA pseudouridine(38-40) synthase TruA [Bacteroidetes bacterium]|nr:MAG: tRNA pseudouridine(38-40) synthase TruA [Bacteroidota bacterium]
MENKKDHRYFIRLAYNGTRYNGWQIQKNAPSVQAVVNDAVSKIFQQEINVTGCGRTDTGVHARDFYIHFDLPYIIGKEENKTYLKKLNGFLPPDISMYEILPVKEDAHTRFDAIARTYQYFISREKDPFNQDFSWFVYGDIDIDRLNEAANILFGYSDFTSFSKVNTDTKTNNCKIKFARWEEKGNMLVFTITADRFLRNMVRAIVGTLLDIGRGKNDLAGLKKIIESKNRSNAGYSVPAKGLFLTKVKYPENLFL